jgi:hypothetical protein
MTYKADKNVLAMITTLLHTYGLVRKGTHDSMSANTALTLIKAFMA